MSIVISASSGKLVVDKTGCVAADTDDFSVLSIVIWFLILSDTRYEIIEKETIHPCQQNAIDLITFEDKVLRIALFEGEYKEHTHECF